MNVLTVEITSFRDSSGTEIGIFINYTSGSSRVIVNS